MIKITEKRFTKVEHIFELNDEGIKDNQTRIEYYYALDLIDLLNELSEENKQLKDKLSEYEKENENQNNVLEDFMTITNRLQSEPNNKSLLLMARDMLRMMGKDIMGDSE